MATIQNERDKTLQAASVRFVVPPNLKAARDIEISASATQFKQPAGGGATTPTSISFVATLKMMTGTVTWSIINGTATLVPSGNSATIAGSSMSTGVVTVQATLNYDGDTYTKTISISKVEDGAAGAPGTPGAPGAPGSRGSVSLFVNVAGSSWSDAVANNLITSNTGSSTKVVGDEVTQANSSAVFAQTRYWSGTAWVIRTNDIPASRITGQLATGQISGLGALALLNSVNLGSSQVVGSLPNSNVSGLGNLATQNTVNATTQVTNLGNLAFANSIAANQIGAGTLAAGVIYSGIIYFSSMVGGEATFSNFSGTVSIGQGTSGLRVSRSSSGSYPTSCAVISDAASGTNDNWPLWVNATGRSRAAYFTGNSKGASWNFSHPVVRVHGFGSSGSMAVIMTVDSQHASSVALQVQNTAASTQGNIGTSGHAFYAASGTYGPFTGSHEAAIDPADLAGSGDIMVDAELLHADSLIDTFHRIEQASEVNQKGAIGVLTRRLAFGIHVPAAYRWPDHEWDPAFDYVRDHYQLAIIAAVGEGQINVCGRGGDIEKGDLIVCSSMPGKGQKQNDDVVRSITVAKARTSVSFNGPDEVKLIPCIYLCG